MASLLIDYVAENAVTVAIFALDQGIQLFVTSTEDKISDTFQDLAKNGMDTSGIYDKTLEKGVHQYVNLKKATEKCLKQIENLSMVWEAADFGTALDYLSDAWRALRGNNIKLFKESIYDAYKFARIAKTKITKNPNHLLGVYSIIIFCGFCKFSEFGEDITLGLKHIKDTLNDMVAGAKKGSLLKNTMTKTMKTKNWKKDQKLFAKNVILFGIRVHVLVQNIIEFSKQNALQNAKLAPKKKEIALPVPNGNELPDGWKSASTPDGKVYYINEITLQTTWDKPGAVPLPPPPTVTEETAPDEEAEEESKQQEEEEDEGAARFGDLIATLFPNATANKLESEEELMDYKTWCPDPFSGKYLGATEFKQIDFFDKIYPLMLEDGQINQLLTFMKIYKAELSEYLSTSKDVIKAMNACIFGGNDDEKTENGDDDKRFVHISSKVKSDYVALALGLQEEINALSDPDKTEMDDDGSKKKKDKYKSYSLNIPDRLVIGQYSTDYDIIFLTGCTGITQLEFDACPTVGLEQFIGNATKNRADFESLTEIKITKTKISSTHLNQLMGWMNITASNLKAVYLQSLQIEFDYFDQKNNSDSLNLSLIPPSVEIFGYNEIQCIENKSKKSDKYNDKVIKKVSTLNLGGTRQIIGAMDAVDDDTDVDEIQKYLKDNLSTIAGYIFMSNESMIESVSNEPDKALTTIDCSSTLMNEYNLTQLFNFIGKDCRNMNTLNLAKCGLSDGFIVILSQFFTQHWGNSICQFKLDNTNVNENVIDKGKDNIITKEGIDGIENLMKEQLSQRSDVEVSIDNTYLLQYYKTSTISGNMGKFQWQLTK